MKWWQGLSNRSLLLAGFRSKKMPGTTVGEKLKISICSDSRTIPCDKNKKPTNDILLQTFLEETEAVIDLLRQAAQIQPDIEG